MLSLLHNCVCVFKTPSPHVVMSGGMAGTFLSSISMALWSANAANTGVAPYRLLLQDDGALRLYDSRNTVVWRA